MDPQNQNQGPDSLAATTDKPQIIKPEDMFNPSVPSQMPAPSSGTPPAQPTPPTEPPMPDSGMKKKIILIAGGGVLLLTIITVVVLLTSSGGNGGEQNQQQQQQDTSGILKEPTALDIENANNAISSDITGLNDDNDFPPNNLDDLNLRL